MIVPMKHLTILCLAHEKKAALKKLSALNAMHIEAEIMDSSSIRAAAAELDAAEQALRVLSLVESGGEMNFKVDSASPVAAMDVPELLRECKKIRVPARSPAHDVSAVNEAAALLTRLNEERTRLDAELRRFAAFGDFDPENLSRLAAEGRPVVLVREPLSTEDGLSAIDDRCVIPFEADDRFYRFAAVIGEGKPLPKACEVLAPPALSPELMRRRITEISEALAAVSAKIAAAADELRPRFTLEFERRKESRIFVTVAENMHVSGAVAHISGFIPVTDEARLVEAVETEGWGISLRDPLPDERPPTLLEPPRIFRPIIALFKGLGFMPAYNEVDVSIAFYAFFTLFFAMLVGDAGYGILILIATVLARRKWPKAPSAPFTLITVFAVATTIWGILSCSWFGIDQSLFPAWMVLPTAAWLGDTGNIMQFCFTIGAVHLSLARIWNAVLLAPSTRMFSELGWTGVVWSMYCVTCSIVVPGFAFPGWVPYLLGISVLMIILFMHSRSEVKENIVDYPMLFLNVLSCMSDIISYVRLYAVSMASVQLASNFNSMAVGLELPLALKIPAMLLILLLGHGLNLMMGALSVLVHAVRLNTLEFSSAKGITWSGIPFSPFNSAPHSAEKEPAQ